MEREEADVLASGWVDAWNSADPERIASLLHPNAVIAEPVEGKIRPPLLNQHLRRLVSERHVAISRWQALPGADSVAVVAKLADGSDRVDTLVVAEDGRIVRVMSHGAAARPAGEPV